MLDQALEPRELVIEFRSGLRIAVRKIDRRHHETFDFGFEVASLLAGVAAVVMLARFNSANAAYGESYLLVTILAAVLGGVDPFGGFGKVGGLLLALIILQVISSAFNLLNLSQFLTLAIWGGILIAVAAVPHLGGKAPR